MRVKIILHINDINVNINAIIEWNPIICWLIIISQINSHPVGNIIEIISCKGESAIKKPTGILTIFTKIDSFSLFLELRIMFVASNINGGIKIML